MFNNYLDFRFGNIPKIDLIKRMKATIKNKISKTILIFSDNILVFI